jgi:acetate kinase
MGLTPLEGLIMGTRSGDLDPGLSHYLASQGIELADYQQAITKAGGLLAIAGDNDMRTLLERRAAGDDRARLAIAMFVYRLRKTVGSYAAALGGLDALVFTAGIGENAAVIREETCAGLEFLGIKIMDDSEILAEGIQRLSDSMCEVLVVPTNEELELAKSAAATLVKAAR